MAPRLGVAAMAPARLMRWVPPAKRRLHEAVPWSEASRVLLGSVFCRVAAARQVAEGGEKLSVGGLPPGVGLLAEQQAAQPQATAGPEPLPG